MPTRRSHLLPVAAVLALAFTFVSLAWRASLQTSPTVDESLHAVGAHAVTHLADHRINVEDPPLWQYLAALPHNKNSLHLDTASPSWNRLLADFGDTHWQVPVDALYHTPGVDGPAFIQRSRAVMTALGFLLLLTVALWTRSIAGPSTGPLAAVFATLLLALDPNFLAHAPLVKNDVPFTLALLATVIAAHRLGQRASLSALLLTGLAAGAALTVKFSGLLVAPLLAILLLTRAVLPQPWTILNRERTTRLARAQGALVLLILVGVISVACIWSVHRFRFRPSPDPNVLLDLQPAQNFYAYNAAWAKHPGHHPSQSEVDNFRLGHFPRALIFAAQHRLLPQPYLDGLLYTHASTLVRPAYLLGQHRLTGWPEYFPLAILFKTPTPTLLAFLMIIPFLLRIRRTKHQTVPHPQPQAPPNPLPPSPTLSPTPNPLPTPTLTLTLTPTDSPSPPPLPTWTLLSLLLPPSFYLAMAMQSHLNLGLRHVLPIYPYLFILAALAFASLHTRRPKLTTLFASLILLALTAETLRAFPNYIAFFNTPTRACADPIHLLGDSNLDWGQGLPALKRWQDQNPTENLYLCYFGTADPAAYNIRYTNLPFGYRFTPPPPPTDMPPRPGVLAISATKLQGIYFDPPNRIYAPYLTKKPRAILAGSIYLFDYTP